MNIPQKITQHKSIIDYLESKPSGATVREMMIFLKINSPTKRISELIKMGYPIEKDWAYRKNSRGETKRFKVYKLRKEC